jgi:hypothetical protein
MAKVIALLAQKRAELKALMTLWGELSTSFGVEAAEQILTQTIYTKARKEGESEAPKDPKEANLKDFLRAFTTQNSDGGTTITEASLEGDELKIFITHCAYLHFYTSMALPSPMTKALTCGREESFANGYDKRVQLVSTSPPTKKGESCVMVFRWSEPYRLP